jgi:type VI protein secretion system component VasA
MKKVINWQLPLNITPGNKLLKEYNFFPINFLFDHNIIGLEKIIIFQ